MSPGVIHNTKVAFIISPQSNGEGIMVFIKAGTNVPFDFTISDVFCYEGAYANPPRKIVSLDCNPNCSFVNLRQWYGQVGKSVSVQMKTTKGWRRLYRIPNLMDDNNKSYPNGVFSFFGELLIWKGYSSSFYADYKAEIMYVRTYSNNTPKYYLNVTTNHWDAIFTKFRLVKDNSAPNHIYLEGYYNLTAAEWVSLGFDYFCHGGVNSVDFMTNWSAINYKDSDIKLIRDVFAGINVESNTIYSNQTAISTEVTPTCPLTNVIA